MQMFPIFLGTLRSDPCQFLPSEREIGSEFSSWTRALRLHDQAYVSQKSRKLYGSEKPYVKLQPAYSVKVAFLYVVKGIKI